jgi:hypothetical protein
MQFATRTLSLFLIAAASTGCLLLTDDDGDSAGDGANDSNPSTGANDSTDEDRDLRCDAYIDKVDACLNTQQALVQRMVCENLYQLFSPNGPDCEAAIDAFYACKAALTCEEFLGSDPTCAEEDQAILQICL